MASKLVKHCPAWVEIKEMSKYERLAKMERLPTLSNQQMWEKGHPFHGPVTGGQVDWDSLFGGQSSTIYDYQMTQQLYF